ncbi:LEAF RUST 10 DISEASE-RESISTANCE LOCUS RECEPTOR-LIKE PROTEIN KINASE-like 2.2 [Impatiens glandulifera]|uniref:LEAF RUST 10 DISEASE-RESISTANCE LOCUS RECEPTOR-LIKE PROTEIN KINASE-like 2.2 n=1 Tax=Impatiens glandulifera TaxID=253017 RepID=UPI001FB0BBA8|nr:LEAF RUST 10 DISEASE-RESISTANCE LOCUS RECEPTOR-LIKE PROTEIN KINASE-like 2.2 [Impatiens glandulifera]
MFEGRSILLLYLLLSVLKCHASSSCGDIQNIDFPFRLQDEVRSKNCLLDDTFSLTCHSNRTYLSLYSGKYLVRSINYLDRSIRLSDVGVDSTVCSSLPFNSLNRQNFTWDDPYSYYPSNFSSPTTTVVFLSCEFPVKSPSYIDVFASCNNRSSSSSSSKPIRYLYALLGNIVFRDIADSCKVETVSLISDSILDPAREAGNVSFQDIHKGLAFGFDIFWQFLYCKDCENRASCLGYAQNASNHCSQLGDCIIRLKKSAFEKFQSWILNNTVSTVIANYVILFVIIIVVWFLLRIFCMPCVFGFLIYKFKRRHLSTFDSIEGFLRSQNNLVPIRYSYNDIRKMTKGFQHKLGQGGYGSVYKGTLRSGSLVAVKILNKAKSDGQEFINEVSTIGRIHHVNVVQLIGYSAERSQRALVYDFMPKGSLEKYIFSKEEDKTVSLTSDQIFMIALGVARGIEYLHRGCDMQILHFDIKPHNILLDEDFTPKVSDFGLAKLYKTEDSIVALTAVRGTMGYMAPELFYKNIGGVSYKADVYSFGMLLMEMAGRRRNWNSSVDHSSQVFFPCWVFDQFNEGKNVEIEDLSEEEGEIVHKMMLVALWCIQMKPCDRPSMHNVVEMLEGDIKVIKMPPKPFFTMANENEGIAAAASESFGCWCGRYDHGSESSLNTYKRIDWTYIFCKTNNLYSLLASGLSKLSFPI